jgi:hypothetical protein
LAEDERDEMTKVWIVCNQKGEVECVFSSKKKAKLYCAANNDEYWFIRHEVDCVKTKFEPYEHGLLFWNLVHRGIGTKFELYKDGDGYEGLGGHPVNMSATLSLNRNSASIPDIDFNPETTLLTISLWAKDKERAVLYATLLMEQVYKSCEPRWHADKEKGISNLLYFVNLGTWQDALAWEQSKGGTNETPNRL